MDNELNNLRESGALRDIDVALADLAGRIAPDSDGSVQLAAALVSRFNGDGHTCMSLTEIAGQPFPSPEAQAREAEDRENEETKPSYQINLPDLDTWREALQSPEAGAVVGSPGEQKMLVLDDTSDRVYLHRFWQYENELARTLAEYAEPDPQATLPDNVGPRLDDLFGGDSSAGAERQRLAAFCAVRNRLTIITGGPGTGKTYTIARVMAMLSEVGGKGDPDAPFRIRLAAPTGKAAARMAESIRDAKQAPELEHIADQIPEEASTLHRLLGMWAGRASPRYNRQNPLQLETLIVDEASMIDLPLMAKLIAAMPDNARLILLGDMNQLASVDPGAVLGDICQAGEPKSFSQTLNQDYSNYTGSSLTEAELAADKCSPLTDCIVQLTHSRRFGEDSAIASVSSAINDGEVNRVVSDLKEDKQDLTWLSDAEDVRDAEKRPRSDLRRIIVDNYRDFLNADADEPLDVLGKLGEFRVLCALRRGRTGVSGLNALIEEVLSLKHFKETAGELGLEHALAPTAGFYHRRPIIVTENDYSIGLFNGDVGVILRHEDEATGEDKYTAYFEQVDASGTRYARAVPAAMLPAHQTAFAMTVHKSQGSEFNNVLLVLPSKDNTVLTRELLYTGITRARKHVDLWAPEDIIRSTIQRPTGRASGLRDALTASANV